MTRQLLVAIGARPNFVKAAPVVHAMAAHRDVAVRVLHTGQHYDYELAGAFLEQLRMPRPDFELHVGSGTHAEQTAGVLIGVERVVASERIDAVLVVGDVNSTMAAALAATKAGAGVIHLEAGLRSGDWTMAEEVNRVVTDRVADLLLCHSEEAVANLRAEAMPPERIFLVGNTMIDSLLELENAAAATRAAERLGLARGEYALATLHRPALVDDAEALAAVLAALRDVAERIPVVIPMHPRTQARVQSAGIATLDPLVVLGPLTYLEFICLEAQARLVVTDSGGVQEETSALGVPCITYRTTTDRPVTVSRGTNRVVGTDAAALRSACGVVLDADPPAARPSIPLWDGHAGERAAEVIASYLHGREPVAPSADAAHG